MKFNLTFLLLLSALLTFSSCKKDDEPVKSIPVSLDEFHKSQLNPEIFTVSAEEDIIIIGRQGTKLTIPKTAIPDITGNLTIKFEELFKKSDLVLKNVPTQARSAGWLETGGSFFLDIRDAAGDEVFISDGIRLDFPISDKISNPTDMSVWSGGSDVSTDFEIWRRVNNAITGEDSAFVQTNLETNEYNMFCASYNWINCDYEFESTAQKVQVQAKILNDSLPIDKVGAFIVFKNINAVLSLYSTDLNQVPSVPRFVSFEIPVGEEAHLVIIGLDDAFYLRIEPFTVAENQIFEFELEELKEEELIEAVKVFD